MRSATENIETSDQKIMDALEDGIINYPGRLWRGADDALNNCGAIVVPEYRQSIAIYCALSIWKI